MITITIDLVKTLNGDVYAYKQGTDQIKARWDSYRSDKPDYRYKYVMLNCYRYKINWIK